MKEINTKRGSYKKFPYKKGQVIDKITILEDDFSLIGDRYLVKFQCECGKIDYKRESHIDRMQVKTCKYCSRKNKYPEQRKSRGFFINQININWITYLNSNDNLNRGVNKKLKCFITIDDLKNQLIKQNFKCAYTGRKLHVLNVFKKDSNASIDRIDSNKNYTVDNIQWIYKPINTMKNSFSSEDFLEICKEISNYTRQL